MQGKGNLYFGNGDSYEGYFKNGKIWGLGCYKSRNYEYYGPFKNDVKYGKGSLFYLNGDKYEGWFEDDKLHGYG